MPFIILFFLIPLIEIYTFIEVGGQIGGAKTVLLCLLTAFIGGLLVKAQGVGTLMGAQKSLRAGITPLEELFNGFCLIIAGALLLTPGFVTDFIGFTLLFPPFRHFLHRRVKKSGRFSINMGQNAADSPFNNSNHNQKGDDIIEGQYKDVSNDHEKLEK